MIALFRPAPRPVDSTVVSAVLAVVAETSTVPPVAVEPPFMNAWLMLLSSVTAAPRRPGRRAVNVRCDLVVSVDVMLRIPLSLPAQIVEPPPTEATASELTTDSAIAASTGSKALPPTFVPTVGAESTLVVESVPIVMLPLAPVDRDNR